MTQANTPKSTGEIMADIMDNVSKLVRSEVDLARAEISGSLAKAAGAIGSMSVALVLAITGLNVLAAFLVTLAVEAGLSPPWASVLVGVALLFLALFIFLGAKSTLTKVGIVPTRTVQNIQRDAAAIKDAYNDK